MKEKFGSAPNPDPEQFPVSARDQKIKPELVAKLRELLSPLDQPPEEKFEWTEDELNQIVDAFTKFNLAIRQGIPKALFNMLAKRADVGLAEETYKNHAIWYAHEGIEFATESVRDFSHKVIKEIKKTKNWQPQQYHDWYDDKESSGDDQITNN